jgi:hypothetical protein
MVISEQEVPITYCTLSTTTESVVVQLFLQNNWLMVVSE